MRPRYLLIIVHGDRQDWPASQLAALTGLDVVHEQHAIIALANPDCGALPLADGGVVLGTVFPRHGPPRALRSPSQSDLAFAIGDQHTLLTQYWGGYISATIEGNAISVMRDPSGALACYWAQSPTATILASDIDLLSAIGVMRCELDWEALARFLFWNGLPVAETVLARVKELLPGFNIRLEDGRPTTASQWSPWDFVRPDGSGNIGLRIERLERTIRNCVLAWASVYRRPLVSVSGGLDSSIVAACLATPGIGGHCLTMYTDDPSGDEREYASVLCDHLGLPLSACHFALRAIDIARPIGQHLPRPIGRAQEQAYEDAHIAIARQKDADAFFTGNGGDNIFGYSQSAAAIADRLLHEGLSFGVNRTIRDVCKHVGCGPISAIGAAIKIARNQRSYHWRPDSEFLDPALAEAMHPDFPGHPWLVSPPKALPGKAAHIAALLRVQMNTEPGRSRHAPVVNPLLSQPILEVCLGIQSWEWRSGGRDRALARDAFAAALPRQIVTRRAKGTPEAFCNAIIRQNRDLILERLLDGHLARQRIVDGRAIEEALATGRMIQSTQAVRLLQLLNVEAWLEQYCAGQTGSGTIAR